MLVPALLPPYVAVYGATLLISQYAERSHGQELVTALKNHRERHGSSLGADKLGRDLITAGGGGSTTKGRSHHESHIKFPSPSCCLLHNHLSVSIIKVISLANHHPCLYPLPLSLSLILSIPQPGHYMKSPLRVEAWLLSDAVTVEPTFLGRRGPL